MYRRDAFAGPMQNKMKDKGVVVLAVSIDADDAAYHKFLKDYSVSWSRCAMRRRSQARFTARSDGLKPT